MIRINRASIYPPELLQDPIYQPITYVGRSIHLNDYEESFLNGKLKTRAIDGNSYCYSQLVGRQVYWFGSCDTPYAHDWYGNVNLKIELEKLLEYFDYKGYIIDYAEYKTNSSTRILFTSKSINNLPQGFRRLNIYEYGSPYYMKNGKLNHATNCKRKSGDYNMNGHNVEIIIEPSEEDAIWLLEVCEKTAVNHSNANQRSFNGFQPKICRTFNSLAKMECPYPFTITETEAKMREIEERISVELEEVSNPDEEIWENNETYTNVFGKTTEVEDQTFYHTYNNQDVNSTVTDIRYDDNAINPDTNLNESVPESLRKTDENKPLSNFDLLSKELASQDFDSKTLISITPDSSIEIVVDNKEFKLFITLDTSNQNFSSLEIFKKANSNKYHATKEVKNGSLVFKVTPLLKYDDIYYYILIFSDIEPNIIEENIKTVNYSYKSIIDIENPDDTVQTFSRSKDYKSTFNYDDNIYLLKINTSQDKSSSNSTKSRLKTSSTRNDNQDSLSSRNSRKVRNEEPECIIL